MKELFIHCDICDRDMSDKEIQYNEDLKTYESCTTCLDIAMEAAYTGQFKTEDDVYELLEDDFDNWDGIEVINFGLDYDPYQEEFRVD